MKYSALQNDITRDDHTFHSEFSFASYKRGLFTVGRPGKQIIGFRIISEWNDGRNGVLQIVPWERLGRGSQG